MQAFKPAVADKETAEFSMLTVIGLVSPYQGCPLREVMENYCGGVGDENDFSEDALARGQGKAAGAGPSGLARAGGRIR